MYTLFTEAVTYEDQYVESLVNEMPGIYLAKDAAAYRED